MLNAAAGGFSLESFERTVRYAGKARGPEVSFSRPVDDQLLPISYLLFGLHVYGVFLLPLRLFHRSFLESLCIAIR